MVASLADDNAPYEWQRGPCEVRDGIIHLDVSRSEKYDVSEARPVALELANLYPHTEKKTRTFERDVIAFVGRHGLLTRDQEQPLGDFVFFSGEFYHALLLHKNIIKASEGNDEALRSLMTPLKRRLTAAIILSKNPLLSEEERRQVSEMCEQFSQGRYWTDYTKPLTEEQRWEVLYDATLTLTDHLNYRLSCVTTTILSELSLARRSMMQLKAARSGNFMVEHRVDNLLDFAYLRLAYYFLDKAPIWECPMCGKFFDQKKSAKKKSKYCSTACANNFRGKRHKEKSPEDSSGTQIPLDEKPDPID